jgi:hypothetical protein
VGGEAPVTPVSTLDSSFLTFPTNRAITAQECTNKTLTTDPFSNTYEADEVSPEVEAGVVVGLRCLQP